MKCKKIMKCRKIQKKNVNLLKYFVFKKMLKIKKSL